MTSPKSHPNGGSSPRTFLRFGLPSVVLPIATFRTIYLATAVLLFVIHATAVAAVDSDLELPLPTGKFAVGTISLPLVDYARKGIYDDGTTSQGREMMIQIWYPAATRASGPRNEYTDEATMLYALSGESEPEPDIRLLIQTHATVRARMPSGCNRFPVVVFSPGLGLFYAVYQSFLEDLASRGYIVIAVNSPDAAGITVFPDGHVRFGGELPESSQVDAWIDRTFRVITDDLKFVTHELRTIDRRQDLPLAGRIRLRDIGCFGHSIGGAAAVQACIETPDIAGALNIDGTFRGEGYKRSIKKPMMLVLAENHPVDETISVVWGNLRQGGFMIKNRGTGHLSFTDEPFLLAALGTDPSADPDFGTIDPARCIRITREAVRGFFDTVLCARDEIEVERLLRRYADVQVSVQLPARNKDLGRRLTDTLSGDCDKSESRTR